MPTFVVAETALYEVEADNEEHAEQVFLDAIIIKPGAKVEIIEVTERDMTPKVA